MWYDKTNVVFYKNSHKQIIKDSPVVTEAMHRKMEKQA